MKPIIGVWYKQEGVTQPFEVIAIDKDVEMVTIGSQDGTVEEMEFEDWNALIEDGQLTSIDPPDEDEDRDPHEESYEDEP